jgi:hypothetical protein
MLRPALIVMLVCGPILVGAQLRAQDEEVPSPEDIERIIEDILELRGQAASLLEALPPELKREVERRWLELQTAAAEVVAEEAPQDESIVETPSEPAIPVAAEATDPPSDLPPPPEPDSQPTLEPEPELEPTVTSEEVSEPAPESMPEPEPEPAKECDSLGPFDTNGDGVISAADRNWRYLRLRADMGGRSTDMGDLESLYDLEIREIDVNLRFYKLSDGAAGDIFIDDRIRFDLLGKRKSSRRSMILFVQASRLARSGELQLVNSSGALLAGDQPLAPGVALQTAEGSRLPLLCP